MKKHFYSHIIEIDTVYSVIDVLDLDDHEKKELTVLIESTIHHTIMDTVLSELSEKDKKIFLSHASNGKYDDVWSHLKMNINKIEHKINHAVNSLMHDLHIDIEETIKHK